MKIRREYKRLLALILLLGLSACAAPAADDDSVDGEGATPSDDATPAPPASSAQSEGSGSIPKSGSLVACYATEAECYSALAFYYDPSGGPYPIQYWCSSPTPQCGSGFALFYW